MREPYPLQQDIEFEKLKFKQSVELSQRVFKRKLVLGNIISGWDLQAKMIVL